MLAHFFKISIGVWLTTALVWAAPEIYPLDQIRPGQTGVVHTVLSGSKIETVKVEIRGVLTGGLGPGRDMIIGRLVDEKTRVIGAVHGMSGSPLYIEGKLAGALSRRLTAFEKDGHCGFTPAADMIDVARRGVPDPAELNTSATSGTRFLSPLSNLWEQQESRPPEFLSIPLQISGGAGGWDLLADSIQKWLPATIPITGGGRAEPRQKKTFPAIEAGSALSVVLMDGDISMVGTGTTTWVDEGQAVGFGHPMLGLGPTALPLAPAEIVSVVPSYLKPHKLANAGPISGTMDQDRLSAISGRIGPIPEMATYRVNRTHEGEARPSWEGRLVRHPLLAPQLIATLANNAMMDPQDFSREFTLRVRMRISWKDQPDLEMRTIYTGNLMERMRALFSEVVPIQRLYFQFGESLELQNVEMEVESLQQGILWQLVDLEVERDRVRVGESVDVRILMENDKGKQDVRTIRWSPPEELAGDSIQLTAQGGGSLDRKNRMDGQISRTREPAEAIRLLNQSYREDAIYLRAARMSTGVQQGSSIQTGLPHGIFQVATSGDHPDRTVISESRIYKENLIPVEGTVSGQAGQTLKILPRR